MDWDTSDCAGEGNARARKLSGRLVSEGIADNGRLTEKVGEVGGGASLGMLGTTTVPGIVGLPAKGTRDW